MVTKQNIYGDQTIWLVETAQNSRSFSGFTETFFGSKLENIKSTQITLFTVFDV